MSGVVANFIAQLAHNTWLIVSILRTSKLLFGSYSYKSLGNIFSSLNLTTCGIRNRDMKYMDILDKGTFFGGVGGLGGWRRSLIL